MANSGPSTPSQAAGLRPAVAEPWSTSTVALTALTSGRSRALSDMALELSDSEISELVSTGLIGGNDQDPIYDEAEPAKTSEALASTQPVKRAFNWKRRPNKRHLDVTEDEEFSPTIQSSSSPDGLARQASVPPQLSEQPSRSQKARVALESTGLLDLIDTDGEELRDAKKNRKPGKVTDQLHDRSEDALPKKVSNAGPQQLAKKPAKKPAKKSSPPSAPKTRATNTKAKTIAKLIADKEEPKEDDIFAMPESPGSAPEDRARTLRPRRAAPKAAPSKGEGRKGPAKPPYGESKSDPPRGIRRTQKLKEKTNQQAGSDRPSHQSKRRGVAQEDEEDNLEMEAENASKKPDLSTSPLVHVISSDSETDYDVTDLLDFDSLVAEHGLLDKHQHLDNSGPGHYTIKAAADTHLPKAMQDASSDNNAGQAASEAQVELDSSPISYAVHHASDTTSGEEADEVPLPAFESRGRDWDSKIQPNAGSAPRTALNDLPPVSSEPLSSGNNLSHQYPRSQEQDLRPAKRQLPILVSDEAYTRPSKKPKPRYGDRTPASEATLPIAYTGRIPTGFRDKMDDPFVLPRDAKAMRPPTAFTRRLLSNAQQDPAEGRAMKARDFATLRGGDTTHRRTLTEEMMEEFSQYHPRAGDRQPLADCRTRRPIDARNSDGVRQPPRAVVQNDSKRTVQQVWEEESESYGEIRQTMSLIIKKILRYLKSQEDAVDDVSEEYRRRGSHILEKLGKRHDSEHQDLLESFEKQRAAYARDCRGAHENMHGLEGDLAAVALTDIARSLPENKASRRLQALRDELGIAN